MKPFTLTLQLLLALLLFSCTTEEASEHERVSTHFNEDMGLQVSNQQWWRTAVKVNVSVTTDDKVELYLLSSPELKLIYDYKVLNTSSAVTMTAPQTLGDVLTLAYIYKGKTHAKSFTLTGAAQESVTLNTITGSASPLKTRADGTPPASLSGKSIHGNATYRQLTNEQMPDFYRMMNFSKTNADAKTLGLNCNYELESRGPFYITWVNGYEADQRSHILGYFYHSADTWADIVYVDLCETHKWDYIDGLSKVQYQIAFNDVVDGHQFLANTWYDANFDLTDFYGATTCANMDRVGDNAYNSQVVYTRYSNNVSAMRGISFEIDVPEGKRVGFYLRSDEEPYPEQWTLFKSLGIKPYAKEMVDFAGGCYCVEFMNVVGNGNGLHRSFIKEYNEMYWMGMEDLVHGGDHDCNDVIFGVTADMPILMPTVVDPLDPTNPQPDPDPDPDPDPELSLDDYTVMPWTIAYEDVNRNADFDFNDAVIKLVPDYENELCCVTVMAAGSTERMYLHFDGPDGDQNLGEIHELLGSRNDPSYINTTGAVASTPFVEIDCVPWPSGYVMGQDANRFYIEVKRGTCADCSDIITLASEPGQMPEALLVAGEWKWPMEGVPVYSAYADFSKWAHDVTRTRFWEWYATPEYNTFVTY